MENNSNRVRDDYKLGIRERKRKLSISSRSGSVETQTWDESPTLMREVRIKALFKETIQKVCDLQFELVDHQEKIFKAQSILVDLFNQLFWVV
jgi:hypothetical protein